MVRRMLVIMHAQLINLKCTKLETPKIDREYRCTPCRRKSNFYSSFKCTAWYYHSTVPLNRPNPITSTHCWSSSCTTMFHKALRRFTKNYLLQKGTIDCNRSWVIHSKSSIIVNGVDTRVVVIGEKQIIAIRMGDTLYRASLLLVSYKRLDLI
jgi:hypothetical protein